MPEPEWDEESRELVQAAELVCRLTGPNGEWLPDATADGADPNEYESGYRYAVSGPFINWAEKTKLDAIDEHRKSLGDDANMNGIYFAVDRVEDSDY